MFTWNDRTANIEFVKNTKADKLRTIKYVIKDGDYLVDNCNLDALLGKNKEKKYDTKRILETDIKELVNNGEISYRDYNSVVKAQAHWKLINAKVEDLESTKGIWIVGRPRIGKSKSVRDYGEHHGGLFIKSQNKWWDGYQMEPNVLIDDFDTNTLWHHLKNWADCYSFPAEVKGATVNVNFRWLFITSNYTIEECMRQGNAGLVTDGILLEALEARFKVIDCRDFEKGRYLTYKDIEEVTGESQPKQKEMEPPLESDIGQESLPKEPSLQSIEEREEIASKRPPPSIEEIQNEMLPTLSESQKDIIFENCMKIINHQPSSEEIEKLPRLAAEEEAPSPAPQKQSSETELDDLDLMSTSEHIDWSAMRAECHDDPEEEVTDAIPEGDESDPEEEEPSASSLDFSSSLD